MTSPTVTAYDTLKLIVTELEDLRKQEAAMHALSISVRKVCSHSFEQLEALVTALGSLTAQESCATKAQIEMLWLLEYLSIRCNGSRVSDLVAIAMQSDQILNLEIPLLSHWKAGKRARRLVLSNNGRLLQSLKILNSIFTQVTLDATRAMDKLSTKSSIQPPPRQSIKKIQVT